MQSKKDLPTDNIDSQKNNAESIQRKSPKDEHAKDGSDDEYVTKEKKTESPYNDENNNVKEKTPKESAIDEDNLQDIQDEDDSDVSEINTGKKLSDSEAKNKPESDTKTKAKDSSSSKESFEKQIDTELNNDSDEVHNETEDEPPRKKEDKKKEYTDAQMRDPETSRRTNNDKKSESNKSKESNSYETSQEYDSENDNRTAEVDKSEKQADIRAEEKSEQLVSTKIPSTSLNAAESISKASEVAGIRYGEKTGTANDEYDSNESDESEYDSSSPNKQSESDESCTYTIIIRNKEYIFTPPEDLETTIGTLLQAVSDLPCSDEWSKAIQRILMFMSKGLHLFPPPLMTPCATVRHIFVQKPKVVRYESKRYKPPIQQIKKKF